MNAPVGDQPPRFLIKVPSIRINYQESNGRHLSNLDQTTTNSILGMLVRVKDGFKFYLVNYNILSPVDNSRRLILVPVPMPSSLVQTFETGATLCTFGAFACHAIQAPGTFPALLTHEEHLTAVATGYGDGFYGPYPRTIARPERWFTPLILTGMVLCVMIGLSPNGVGFLMAARLQTQPALNLVNYIEAFMFTCAAAVILNIRDNSSREVRAEIQDEVLAFTRKRRYIIRPGYSRERRQEILDVMLKDISLCRGVNLIVYKVHLKRYLQLLFDVQNYKLEMGERIRKYSLLLGPLFQEKIGDIVSSVATLPIGVEVDRLFTYDELEYFAKNLIRRANDVIDAVESVQRQNSPFAGPAESATNAIQNLIQGTIDDMIGLLRDSGIPNFNERQLRL